MGERTDTVKWDFIQHVTKRFHFSTVKWPNSTLDLYRKKNLILIHISKYHVVHNKYMQFLFVSLKNGVKEKAYHASMLCVSAPQCRKPDFPLCLLRLHQEYTSFSMCLWESLRFAWLQIANPRKRLPFLTFGYLSKRNLEAAGAEQLETLSRK